MPFIGLMLLLQVGLIIHVLKTGRDSKWVYVLVLVPGIGSLAYFLLELAPDLLSSRQGRGVSKRVADSVNPNKEMNDASLEYQRSSTVANSTRLAAEYVAKGRHREASELYRSCLSGMNEFDPDILFGLAQSEFGLEEYKEVKSVLDTLIEKNPEYKNQDAHLLYARNAAKLGDIEKAIEEYEVLITYYTGPEPMFRYATLLKVQGEHVKSEALFRSIINKADLSAKHYQSMHREWIRLARKEIN